MKKYISRCLIILALSIPNLGCNPEDDNIVNQNPLPQQQTNNCEINFSLLVDKNWHHITGTLATLRFDSSGIYYENSSNDGNWSSPNNCDSIFVTRPSNSFYYRIHSISQDTLIIHNSVFGFVTFLNQ